MNMKHITAEHYYDNLAPIYDRATENSWAAPKQIENILKRIASRDKNVLDIGIGTGQSIDCLYVEDNYKTLEGIDVSQKMLDLCKIKYPAIITHHGEFISFKNFRLQKYDLIICCGALEFIDDLDRFLKKCASLLHDKGDIVLTYEPQINKGHLQNSSVSEVRLNNTEGSPSMLSYRYLKKIFHSVAAKNGLKINSEEDFPAYKKADQPVIYSLVHLTRK